MIMMIMIMINNKTTTTRNIYYTDDAHLELENRGLSLLSWLGSLCSQTDGLRRVVAQELVAAQRPPPPPPAPQMPPASPGNTTTPYATATAAAFAPSHAPYSSSPSVGEQLSPTARAVVGLGIGSVVPAAAGSTTRAGAEGGGSRGVGWVRGGGGWGRGGGGSSTGVAGGEGGWMGGGVGGGEIGGGVAGGGVTRNAARESEVIDEYSLLLSAAAATSAMAAEASSSSSSPGLHDRRSAIFGLGSRGGYLWVDDGRGRGSAGGGADRPYPASRDAPLGVLVAADPMLARPLRLALHELFMRLFVDQEFKRDFALAFARLYEVRTVVWWLLGYGVGFSGGQYSAGHGLRAGCRARFTRYQFLLAIMCCSCCCVLVCYGQVIDSHATSRTHV